jgi:hypothetical protein
MSDLSEVIKPKSDQLNADDLVGRELTIRIRDVSVNTSAKEQPVAIYFDGDNGKPWKPCKTMSRALVQLWGTPDSQQFIGRSVTLYTDPNVTWGGVKVGGIRIRAVSHIDGPVEIAVSQTKGKRALMRVMPIMAEVRTMPTQSDGDKLAFANKLTDDTLAKIARAPDAEKLRAFIDGRMPKLITLQADYPEMWTRIDDALRLRLEALDPKPGRDDSQMGDGFDGFGD